MTEPSAAAPAGVAPPGSDVLLATKWHVPRPQQFFVPRPRLAEALAEGLARRLILVCAPAGSGKTALLADWARRGQRQVAWLSLEAADNDPVRFWRYVLAALDQARPGIGERVGPLLGPPAPPSFEGLVTALINELAARLAGDLRFTAAEAAALLRESAGADLPAAAVAALAARTEGWVAGLQLAALSLGGQADPAGFVAAVHGRRRHVVGRV